MDSMLPTRMPTLAAGDEPRFVDLYITKQIFVDNIKIFIVESFIMIQIQMMTECNKPHLGITKPGHKKQIFVDTCQQSCNLCYQQCISTKSNEITDQKSKKTKTKTKNQIRRSHELTDKSIHLSKDLKHNERGVEFLLCLHSFCIIQQCSIQMNWE